MFSLSGLTTFQLLSVIFNSVNQHFQLASPQFTHNFPSEGNCYMLCASEKTCLAFTVTKILGRGVKCDFRINDSAGSDGFISGNKSSGKLFIVPKRNAVTYCKGNCMATTLFVSPFESYDRAKEFCASQNAAPFVPKTKKDYSRYVDLSTELDEWGWYPLNDFVKHGLPVYEDGVDYINAPFNPSWWDSNYPNTVARKCTTVRDNSQVAWSGCGWHFQIVCQRSRTQDLANIIVTPLIPYKDALDYCRERNADPFVPKSQEEYTFYTEKVTAHDEWGWFPINDNKTQKTPVFEDGTVYELAPFIPPTWDADYPNTYIRRCVTVSRSTGAAWSECGHSFQLICLKNGGDTTEY